MTQAALAGTRCIACIQENSCTLAFWDQFKMIGSSSCFPAGSFCSSFLPHRTPMPCLVLINVNYIHYRDYYLASFYHNRMPAIEKINKLTGQAFSSLLLPYLHCVEKCKRNCRISILIFLDFFLQVTPNEALAVRIVSIQDCFSSNITEL